MTRVMAIELASYGVRVNAIAPGAIRTEKSPTLDSPRFQATSERIPMRRIGQPEDIAASVLFLSSDEASYIHGTTLFVDGGMISTRG